MSDHNENKIQITLLALLPPLVLLGAETALFLLPPDDSQALASFIAYFAFAVLCCQLVTHVVFSKGEICNGQRSRLVRANLFLLLYWIGLFLLGALAQKRYVPLALLIGAAILLLVTVWQQPKDDERLRRGILLFGTICGGLGVLCYLAILWNLPRQDWFAYSPFSQLLLGLVLSAWQLRLSRNRLQGFIALLPRLMLLSLLLNALYSVVVLLLLHWNLTLLPLSTGAFAGYFALHLLLAALLFWLISSRKTLDLAWLSLLLLLSMGLPFLLIYL
ncbi:hypothetical protein SAMN05660772_00847 [Pasteurella testudinis DSM 23072]|uniref:Uncharacterized protein n=1 Tax=Pasteurella testudinis DSM 23072 TaxID=1122938 RepID=A0A1W1V001_9PAST|nr:hypothetical protein [Pasteurella testudinis]SMB86304.1 hypothetical protein SAMN05660772_00847 [Pasteurella testudinis DSM 23072]SUB51769.1 Uncharacterised protein [Pasteurella testudinis]